MLTVASLHHYPVKSLAGSSVPRLDLLPRGAHLDRQFALYDRDGKIGSGKSTRRSRRIDRLLMLSATAAGDLPIITLPDGEVLVGLGVHVDARLSELLGVDVSLRREADTSHLDAAPIHVLTEGSLTWLAQTIAAPCDLDVRRFRPNLVLRSAGAAASRWEEAWIGSTLVVGDDVELTITERTERCVMTTMAQPALPEAPEVLRTLALDSEACFGVYASVTRSGSVRVGDPVRVRGS